MATVITRMRRQLIGYVTLLSLAMSPLFGQVPEPDLEGIEPALGEQIIEARQLIDDNRDAEPSELAAAWGELGMLYQALEYEEEALAAYREAQLINPLDGRWPYLTGMVLAAQGQTEPARLHFTAAIALMPSQATAAWIRIGRLLLDDGQARQALMAAEKALANNDLSAAALAVKGEALLELDQPQAAVEALEAALELEPRADRLRFPLGMAYRALGDRDRMEQELAQAGQVGIGPDDPVGQYLETHARGSRILTLRARRAFGANDLETALSLFQRAAEVDPEDADLWVNLGVTQSASGQTQAALNSLETALMLDPLQLTARINLATLLQAEGRPEAALAVLAAPGVELDGFDALVLRARIAREVDQLDRAAADYLTALDRDKDLQVWREAIEVLLTLNRYEDIVPLATHPGLNAEGLAQVAGLTEALLESETSNMELSALARSLSDTLFERDDSLQHAQLRARAMLTQQADCRSAIQWLTELSQRPDWAGEKASGARSLALALARQPRCQASH
ncbi:MAG: tetratricopeptide repeat protein [Pseudomonadota bacterium]